MEDATNVTTEVVQVDTPTHDILFEHIQPCPIDDHQTMGISSISTK